MTGAELFSGLDVRLEASKTVKIVVHPAAPPDA